MVRDKTRRPGAARSADGVVIERITPLSVFLMSNGLWLVLLFLTPVTPRWPTDGWPLVLYLLCTLTLIYGALIPHLLGFKFKPVRIGAGNFRLLYRICLALGLAGLALKLVDLIVLRNVELTLDFVENRAAVVATQSSAISTAAAFLNPFGLVCLILTFVAARLGVHQRPDPIGIVIGLASMLLPVIFGSRSSLMLAGLELGFLALLMLHQITARMKLFAVALGVGFIVLFAVLFASRLQQFGGDYKFTARYSAYTLVTPLDEYYLAIIDGADAAVGLMLTAYASILQYILHGVFEFFYLVELKSDNYAWGAQTFFIVPKLVNVLTGDTTQEAAYLLMYINPRAGVFQSLYGPFYIDFGYYCIVSTFFLGMFAEVVRLRFVAGDYMVLPLHLFCLMMFGLAPIESALGLSAGIIAVCSYLGLIALSSVIRTLWGDFD